MGTRTLHPSGAVRDGVCFTSFAHTYLSLGCRFAESATGGAHLCPPRPPSLGRSSQWHLLHYVCRYLLFTGLPVHFRLRRMPHRGTIHLRPHRRHEPSFGKPGRDSQANPETVFLIQGSCRQGKKSAEPILPSSTAKPLMMDSSKGGTPCTPSFRIFLPSRLNCNPIFLENAKKD